MYSLFPCIIQKEEAFNEFMITLITTKVSKYVISGNLAQGWDLLKKDIGQAIRNWKQQVNEKM